MSEAIAPLIGVGGGLLSSIFGGQSDQEKAALKAQQAALGKQGDLAQLLSKIGGDRYTLTNPAYGKAIDYYTALLSGDRAKQMQAVGPDVARLNDLVTGSRDRISNTLVGPARDKALGDLSRSHYEQLAGLTSGPRQAAASTLLSEGKSASGDYLQALAGAGNAYGSQASGYGNAYRSEADAANASNKTAYEFGSSIAKLLGDSFLKPGAPKGDKGTGGPNLFSQLFSGAKSPYDNVSFGGYRPAPAYGPVNSSVPSYNFTDLFKPKPKNAFGPFHF